MKSYQVVYQILAKEIDYVSGEKIAEELSLSRTSIWKAIKRLEQEGIEIDSIKNKGYKLVNGDLILPELLEQNLPIKISFKPETRSTQLDAKEAIDLGNEANTLYLASYQTAGRGRFQRSFYSPQGGIYMTLHLKPNLPYDKLPSYTLLVAGAIYKAIKNLTLIDVDIKWVNDIYLNNHKIGGILTEAMTSVETGLVTDIIIGVGINFTIKDFPQELKEKADTYYEVSVFKLNKVIKTLLSEGVQEVTMLGKVTKEWLYKDHVIPDLRALKVLNRLRKKNFKDDTITLELVEELEKDGISVLDQTKYLKPLMPGPQIFTKRQPTEKEMLDVAFGFKAAKAIGGMDLGQTVVIKDQAVMAVEAIEGTDACIRRGGMLARGGAVVVKTAKPDQDLRFDVPAVGLETLHSMMETRCKVLAIEAYCTLFVEKMSVLKEADCAGIAILSVEQEHL